VPTVRHERTVLGRRRSSPGSTRSGGAPGRGRSPTPRWSCRGTGGCTSCATRSCCAARARAARRRLHGFALGIGIGHAGNDEIDRLGMSEAMRRAARRAVDALPLRPDALLLDGNWDFLAGYGTHNERSSAATPVRVDRRRVDRGEGRPRPADGRGPGLPRLRLRVEQGLPLPRPPAALDPTGRATCTAGPGPRSPGSTSCRSSTPRPAGQRLTRRRPPRRGRVRRARPPHAWTPSVPLVRAGRPAVRARRDTSWSTPVSAPRGQRPDDDRRPPDHVVLGGRTRASAGSRRSSAGCRRGRTGAPRAR
jgi:hypothetical protein